MFSHEDNSGLLAFMIGIVIVVFTGIGLSIVVDRRLSSSNSNLSLEKSVKNGQVEYEELQTARDDLSRRLMMMEARGGNAVSELESIRRDNDALHTRLVALHSRRKELRSAVESLEKGFADYRGKYREAMREAAIHQSLGTLTTLGGREYQEAFITRVTDTGLEIRHKNGFARIKAGDLNPSLQERFQWSRQDPETVAETDNLHSETSSSPDDIPKGDRGAPIKRDEKSGNQDDVEKLRNNLIAWKTKLGRLESERSIALSAARGPRKAPTGSLETWQMRATRLESEIATVHARLAAARASLEVVAPDDPLLRVSSGRQ